MKTLFSFLFIYAMPLLSGNLVFNIGISYDNKGRIDGFRHPSKSDTGNSGYWQSYSFNYLEGHYAVDYGNSAIVSSTEYYSSGLTKKIQFSSFSGLPNMSTHFEYDALGRLKKHTVKRGSLKAYYAYNLYYNDAGFLYSLQRSDAYMNKTISYEYNNNYSLKEFKIGSESASYSYDSRGNMTSRSEFEESNLGFYMPSMSASYNYDNKRTTWSYDQAGKVLADDHYAYVYNGIDQIETVADLDTNRILSHYLYDGSGERVREVYEDQVVYT
ncbi:MAG: hypothetical protein CSA81_02555, partial [Acidobacteria bacterium]